MESRQLQKPEMTPLKLRNMMQMELTRRHCIDCSNADLVDWLYEELSPKFAELIKKNPELLDEFAINADKALEKAEARLVLHDKGVSKP